MSKSFFCDCCQKTFPTEQTEAEAFARALRMFPGMDPRDRSEAATVCDDCFNNIMGQTKEYLQ